MTATFCMYECSTFFFLSILCCFCCDSQSLQARQRKRCSFSERVWAVKKLDAFRAENGSVSA